jgi:hypothetical protein
MPEGTAVTSNVTYSVGRIRNNYHVIRANSVRITVESIETE